MNHETTLNTSNESNFETQNENSKYSPREKIVRFLVREVNANHLSYDALRSIFQDVRRKCKVNVPRKSKKLIELPTEVEMKRFYSVIHNPIHKLMFETLEGTGLRVSELVNMEIARIDFSKNQMFVHEGKGKKDRIVIFGNRLKEKLQIYLNNRNLRFIFESNRNYKFTITRIEQICKQYKEAANIEKELTPHSLRHIWNTLLAQMDVSKDKRKILAGHESDETQDIYTHLAAGGFTSEIIKILDREKM